MLLRLERAVEYHGPTVRPGPDRSGIVRQDIAFRLRHDGSAWRFLGAEELADGADQRLEIREFDPDELTLTAGRLDGRLDVTQVWRMAQRDFVTGVTLHHTPPELKPVIGFNLGNADRSHPYAMTFAIEAERLEDGWEIDWTIQGAVQGERIRGEARDLSLFARREGADWVDGWGLTPGWNRAAHRVDGSGLDIAEDRVRGDLVVEFMPDRWVPGGLRVHRQTFSLDAPLRNGRIDTAARARGDFGEYDVRIVGEVGRALAGRFSAQGLDDIGEGRVSGRVRPADPEPPAPNVP